MCRWANLAPARQCPQDRMHLTSSDAHARCPKNSICTSNESSVIRATGHETAIRSLCSPCRTTCPPGGHKGWVYPAGWHILEHWIKRCHVEKWAWCYVEKREGVFHGKCFLNTQASSPHCRLSEARLGKCCIWSWIMSVNIAFQLAEGRQMLNLCNWKGKD